jgi:hypothetical protein
MALEQLSTYKKAIADNAKSIAEEKESNAKLDLAMQDYEKKLGCVPPGAKSDSGHGRVGHSTHLAIGQPASFGYANHRTTGRSEEDDAAVALATGSTKEAGETPSSKRRKKTRSKSPSTATANSKAASDMSEMNGFFKTVVTSLFNNPQPQEDVSVMTPESTLKKSRIENLKLAKANLMETIRFMKDLDAPADKIQAKMDEFKTLSQQLHEILMEETNKDAGNKK